MSTSPLSPDDIRAAAGAHHELGPEYSDAVVASFLQKVDQEIAARVDARLASMPRTEPPPPRTRTAEPGSHWTALKGTAAGVAIAGAALLLIAGRPKVRAVLLVLIVLAAGGAVGRVWARRQQASRRSAVQQEPRSAVSADYQRLA